MKSIILKGLTCIIICLIAKPAFAQQNLFNIPSGDITNANKLFYQHQLNAYTDKLESKSHLVYGLGKGWDAGLNLVGNGINFNAEPRFMQNDDIKKGALYPNLMGTVQKQFKLTETVDLNIGSQMGYNLSSKINKMAFNYFHYGIGVYYFMARKSRLVGGIYQSNKAFIGEGNKIGTMLGYEIKLNKKWYLMGDWVSGRNDAGVMVLGGMYNLTKRSQICAGWQIPNPNTPKPMAFVFELNLMGWDLY